MHTRTGNIDALVETRRLSGSFAHFGYDHLTPEDAVALYMIDMPPDADCLRNSIHC